MGNKAVVVDGVKRAFPTDAGPLSVVGGVSFEIADGEFVAIVGPSGCGKSSLMNILAGFDRPDSGSVLVAGAPLTGPGPRGILMPQQGSIFPWLTVRENVMFGLLDGSHEDDAALADRYIALVGLEGFGNAYPRELSGGMLKRVELARALVVKPDVLFMDEPFAALDALMSLRLRTELLKILSKERHTVVLITHDVEEALQLADRVLVLSPRPAAVQAVFEVRVPHPRRLSSPEIQTLKEAILRQLGV